MSILTSIASRVIEETVSKMTPGLYSRDCVNSGIDAFIGFKRQEVIEALALKSIQPDGLKSSIRHALLKDSLTKVDISNIATVISSTSLREQFAKWISNPEVIKSMRMKDGTNLEQKILHDISRQVLRNLASFQEWLVSLPENISTSVSKSGGFKSGGIYFTAFGIFLPENSSPVPYPGMTLPIIARQLYEYSGNIIGGEQGMGAIFQITKIDKQQNISNRFYNKDGSEIVFKDAKKAIYKVISVDNKGIVRAKEIINGSPSKNLREYQLEFSTRVLTPLTATPLTTSLQE